MLDLKRTSWNVFSGAQLAFGPNAVTTLTGIATRHAAQRIFLITDNTLEESGAVRQIRKAIDQTDAELHVFLESQVEPSTDTVERTASIARDYKPDLMIALGGGSKMDLAKASRAMVDSGCTAESLLGFNNVPEPTTKTTLICIPTTSGTGSEVSHSAILTGSTTGTKTAVLSQHIRPDIAIVDPYMTLSCPARLTAESGFVALTHAIEAYLATNFFEFAETVDGLPYEGNNPFGDLYAEKAIRLITQHLKRATEEPDHLAARSGMSLAATVAGTAFSNCGGGLCHAFESTIGPQTEHGSHGTVSAIVLPEVVRFLAQHRPGKIKSVAACLNDEFSHLSNDEAPDAVIDFLSQLRNNLDLPGRLTAIGIDASHLPELVTASFSQHRLINLTPGAPTSADGLSILNACLK